MDFKQEILKAINTIIDEKIGSYKADHTFISVVKKKNANGTYVVIDDSGSERTVKCCIPNISLNVGKRVYVKVPMGKLSNMHICGVA